LARVFFSHSSVDDAWAVALRDWMIDQGWNDLFLDLDADSRIKGERWQDALKNAAELCEVAKLLFSWCLRRGHHLNGAWPNFF
jgi:hypothetical protein